MGSPLSARGETLARLHDSLLISRIDDVSAALREAGEKGNSITLETDGGTDELAAAAIMRALFLKLGALAHPAGEPDLFKKPGGRSCISLVIRGSSIHLSGALANIRISARQKEPVYPFPDLSLSGLALKVVDAAFLSGSLDFPDDFVAFDFETTGRDPQTDDIIEIGAVKVRGDRVVESFSSFVCPRRPIPGEVEAITNIGNDTVRGAPRIDRVLPRFLDFCGSLPLVAHNIPFDLAFLKREARLLLGRQIPNDTEDSLSMSRWLYPDAASHRLGAVAEFLGVRLDKWHRAEDDALAAAKIYIALKSRERDTLRDLRLKQYLDIAALGTITSRLPLKGENAILVRHGLAMMLKCLGLGGADGSAHRRQMRDPSVIPEMLLSLFDGERRQASLYLLELAGIARGRGRETP